MDIKKITPAPWEWSTSNSFNRLSCPDGRGGVLDGKVLSAVRYRDGQMSVHVSKDDAEFIAVARNAFDAMMRYGWGVRKTKEGFVVTDSNGGFLWCDGDWFIAKDPFTAIDMARKHKENVEAANAETTG